MPPKRVPKVTTEKKAEKKLKPNDKRENPDAGIKDNSSKKDSKNLSAEKESSKMTFCTEPVVESPRPQRRPGRPASGKRIMSREMPGKVRSAYRRSLDPCDNSNDSGLGFDHHTDPHHHTMMMSERLTWTGERAEPKRLRMDIKVENEEVNDNYCFPNTVRQCKDNISLIRTAPGSSSVSSLSVTTNTSTASGRAAPRCTPIVSRQSPTTPVFLTSQLSSTSRFGDVALTIVKQPEQQHRARYQTEGSRGAVKDREGNGFPVVQLTGYYKPATLQVYIGTDVGKVSPHMFYQACKVSGKNSTPCVEKKIDGTCVIELSLDPSKEMCATCDCVGILKERNVDVEHRFPDQLGNRSKKKSTRCRMIFRTTITHENGTTETLQVCSQPIVCTQPPGIPEICKKSLTSCPASGGLELFVLGKNFLKDTKVYFQQYDDGRVCWEQAVVPDKEYLQQTHFVCVVPPYRRPNITEPVSVRLCVVSSGKTSESHQFVYTPVNGAVSVNLDAQQAQPVQFFKGALWNSSSARKQEHDLDMMPPPESNLVPMSTRRSSISLPSTSDTHSPPLSSMKQEYIDDNSQGSVSDVMDIHHERYRPLSESSLDVNHDSNISMINDNSMDMMHHNSMMGHISENSNLSINEDSLEMVRRNSISMRESVALNEENACSAVMQPIVSERVVLPSNHLQHPVISNVEKVMDLRMKLPMNTTVTDYVTTANSIAALKSFGIEPSSTLPTQSAQSVENYLTKIESKPSVLPNSLVNSNVRSNTSNSEKIDLISAQALPTLLASVPQNMAQSVFLTSQQPFLPETNSVTSIAKSEAAAIAEQTLSEASNTSTANTTITTALEGSIPTPINTERLDEILNSTLESHIGTQSKTTVSNVNSMAPSQEVMLTTESSLLVSPGINTTLASPVLNQQKSLLTPSESTQALINSQISQSLMCQNTSSVQQEPLLTASELPTICQATAASEGPNLLPTTLSVTQPQLLPAVTTQESSSILNSDPEKAVLLEAAVDFLKTQKKISEELTTTAPDIMGIASSSTDSSVLTMQNNMENSFMPFSTITPTNNNASMLVAKNINSMPKSDYIPIAVKDIATTAQNDKKNEDRMIPQSFTSLTENELINLINPSCFDQGNNYHN